MFTFSYIYIYLYFEIFNTMEVKTLDVGVNNCLPSFTSMVLCPYPLNHYCYGQDFWRARVNEVHLAILSYKTLLLCLPTGLQALPRRACSFAYLSTQQGNSGLTINRCSLNSNWIDEFPIDEILKPSLVSYSKLHSYQR